MSTKITNFNIPSIDSNRSDANSIHLNKAKEYLGDYARLNTGKKIYVKEVIILNGVFVFKAACAVSYNPETPFIVTIEELDACFLRLT